MSPSRRRRLRSAGGWPSVAPPFTCPSKGKDKDTTTTRDGGLDRAISSPPGSPARGCGRLRRPPLRCSAPLAPAVAADRRCAPVTGQRSAGPRRARVRDQRGRLAALAGPARLAVDREETRHAGVLHDTLGVPRPPSPREGRAVLATVKARRCAPTPFAGFGLDRGSARHESRGAATADGAAGSGSGAVRDAPGCARRRFPDQLRG